MKRDGHSRARLIGARVLTVLAVLLALVGMLAFYVEHTALDEAGFRSISQRMIEDDAIRTQVTNTSVDLLYKNVDVEAAIADRLPAAQKGLAPVLASLSRSGADRAAVTALDRPRVQKAWVETTSASQQQLVRLLDDKGRFQTEDGKVVLDLRPIMIQLGDRVAVIGRAAERLPASAGTITIVDAGQLDTAQTVTRILRVVADWMTILALAIAALAVWLARGRRRLELRALAIGVILVGLPMLAARRAGGGYLVDHLVKDDTYRPAVRNAWGILSQTLADRAWIWIILGVVLLAGVWFVGGTHRATQARHASQPVLENSVATYSIAAVALLTIALLVPVFTRGWAISLISLALAILGIEVVRSIVVREKNGAPRAPNPPSVPPA